MSTRPTLLAVTVLILLITGFGSTGYSQGTAVDYERAGALKTKYEAAAIDIAGTATWIGSSNRFWYRKLSKGITQYIVVDAGSLQKQVAFDHAKIATSLSKLLNNTYKDQDLPLTALRFDNNGSTFFATVDGVRPLFDS